MKTAIAIATGLVSLGIVGVTPAAAFHLTPPNTNFTATGKTSATKNGVTLPCKATLQGHTDANGIGFVDSGSFADVRGGSGCTAVSLSNLPWEVDAIAKRTVVIHGVQFSTPIGSCGPGDITAKLKRGVLSFSLAPLAPDCTVNSKVKTHPEIQIED